MLALLWSKSRATSNGIHIRITGYLIKRKWRNRESCNGFLLLIAHGWCETLRHLPARPDLHSPPLPSLHRALSVLTQHAKAVTKNQWAYEDVSLISKHRLTPALDLSLLSFKGTWRPLPPTVTEESNTIFHVFMSPSASHRLRVFGLDELKHNLSDVI